MKSLKESIPLQIRENLPKNSYLVGGAVRDHLLDIKNINDWDFVIFGLEDLQHTAKAIADKLNISYVELDTDNGHYRLVNTQDNWQVDLATPRGSNIAEDLYQRDIIINAMAYDIDNDELIDPLSGQADISKQIVRAISHTSLTDDLLRCLRVYRTATKYNFSIDPKTRNFIKNICTEYSILEYISPERISYEIWEILKCNNSYPAIQMMLEDSILENIIPEIQDLRKVPPNSHHHLPLLEHTTELIKQYELMVSHIAPQSQIRDIHSNPNRLAWLKMAMILHDISKPETWEITEEGRHTFYSHDTIGAEKSRSIALRLKWSNQCSDYIWKMVRYHLSPFQIAPTDTQPTNKAIHRLIRKLGDYFPDLLALAWSDTLSVQGQMITDQMNQLNETRLNLLYSEYSKFQEAQQHIPPLLHGDSLKQVIQDANLKPTKYIKEILEDIREKQLNNSIHTTEQATQYFLQKAKEQPE